MRTELITTLEGFKTLEPDWNHLIPADAGIDLPLTWSWFDAWLRGFWGAVRRKDSQARLHIFAIWDAQGIVAIAPMAIYSRLYHGVRIRTTNSLANGSTSYWDLVLRNSLDESIVEQICTEIFKAIPTAVTNLRKLRENSPLRRFLAQSPKYAWKDLEVMRTPLIHCSGDLDTHLGTLSRKYRSRLRKKLKTFDAAGDTRVERKLMGSSLDPLFNQMVEISRQSWKFNEGRDIGSRQTLLQFLSAITDYLGPLGRVEIWIAYRGDEGIAYELHIRSGTVTFPILADYAKSARCLSPGSIVEYHALAASFEDPSIEVYDTCAADYWYLQRISDSYRNTYETMIFSDGAGARVIQFVEFAAKPVYRSLRQLFSRAA